MKYIDEFDIDMVNEALSFNTTDMHIQGTCDLFTTKPVGADRKLYKALDKLYNANEEDNVINEEVGNNKQERQNSNSSNYSSHSSKSVDGLNSQFVQLKNRSFSYSYTKPLIMSNDQESMRRSHSFHSPTPEPEVIHQYEYDSPFGPLSQSSSRKLFGYLIGVLNSTFPDHDFSTVQPNNFTLLPSASELIAKVNSYLISSGKSSGLDWIWQTINTHMELEQCICFQFEPQQSFLDDLGVIWSNMYFVFNKKKKRVAFLYFLATVLNDSSHDLTISRRRNSKAGTLDEEGMKIGEDDNEYDLRYNNDYEPIYEDVFEEDEDENDEIMADNIINSQTKNGVEEYDFDEGNDFEMSDDEDMANINQDDEGFV